MFIFRDDKSPWLKPGSASEWRYFTQCLDSESDVEDFTGQTVPPSSDCDAALDNNKCSDSGEEEERVDHKTAANLAVYCSENPYIKRNEQPDPRTGRPGACDIITTGGPTQELLVPIETPQNAFRLLFPAEFIEISLKYVILCTKTLCTKPVFKR